MKGIFIFIGESFRTGGQHSRKIGNHSSYDEQIIASKSHINLIEFLINKFNLNKNDIKVMLTTYNTKFNNNLINIYKDYLFSNSVNIVPENQRVGITNLFNYTFNKIKNIKELIDFIFLIRIDLFLKKDFYNIIDLNWNTINFTCNCWNECPKCDGHPRINDTMFFFPKKYFNYLNKIILFHTTWEFLIKNTDLTYDDLDYMIKTYHDSNTQNDFNPYYRIVNRPECQTWHSEGTIFNKNDFKKKLALIYFGISYLENYYNKTINKIYNIDYKKQQQNHIDFIHRYFKKLNYDIDIFISTNEENNYNKNILHEYNAKDIKYCCNDDTNNAAISRNIKVKNGIEMCLNYANKNNINYNHVLLTRFDIEFKINFINSNINLKKLNIVSLLEKENFICDNFYLLPFNLLEKYLVLVNENIEKIHHYIKCKYENLCEINFIYNQPGRRISQLDFYKLKRN